jgi:esterase/lipase superfamily enzyme
MPMPMPVPAPEPPVVAPAPRPSPPRDRPRSLPRSAPPETAPPGDFELPCQKPLGTVQPVTLYYATNRGRSGSGKAETFYGHANSGALEFGVLKVTIPPTHKCGKVETSFTEIIFGPDEKKHMVLKEVRPLQQSAYLTSIRDKVAGSKRKEIFVFIHGFNNTFREAALRAAELTFDLGFDGAPILFSWPARGGVTGFAAYTADRGRARESGVPLRIFLNMLATKTNAEQIHVIVHSMGNYVFQNALSKDGQPWPIPALTPKLHEVVLAAADLGEDEVKVLAQALRQPDTDRPHVTLYTSANDNALKASRTWNGRVPIGLIEGIVPAIAGVDVIDATALKCDFLAHSCFAEDPFSLLEMRALITQRWEAAKRAWIAAKDGHWYFCGETCPMHGH